MDLTIGKEKAFFLVIRGLLEDLEDDSFMRINLFQHTLFSLLDL